MPNHGDFESRPYHEAHAKNALFKNRIAPQAMLTAGFISSVLGKQLPGPGHDLYETVRLNFSGAGPLGDTITAKVEVVR